MFVFPRCVCVLVLVCITCEPKHKTGPFCVLADGNIFTNSIYDCCRAERRLGTGKQTRKHRLENVSIWNKNVFHELENGIRKTKMKTPTSDKLSSGLLFCCCKQECDVIRGTVFFCSYQKGCVCIILSEGLRFYQKDCVFVKRTAFLYGEFWFYKKDFVFWHGPRNILHSESFRRWVVKRLQICKSRMFGKCGLLGPNCN